MLKVDFHFVRNNWYRHLEAFSKIIQIPLEPRTGSFKVEIDDRASLHFPAAEGNTLEDAERQVFEKRCLADAERASEGAQLALPDQPLDLFCGYFDIAAKKVLRLRPI